MRIFFRRPLILLESTTESTPGGGSTTTTTNPPATPPATPPAPSPGTSDGGKVFTQEEVNAMIASRARDVVKRELGVDSIEAAKTALQKSKDFEEAQKTEAEKAIDAAKKAGRKEAEQEAETRIAQILEEANRKLIKADVLTVASSLGFHDAEDAWEKCTAAIADSRIKINDKGEIVGTKTVLEKLAKDKPYLIKGTTTPGTPRFNNDGTPLNDLEAKQKAAAENARLAVFGGARRFGM